MKIPATWNGEIVYIVWFDTRNPADAICICHDGSFERLPLGQLWVLDWDADLFGRGFIPPAPPAETA